MNKTQEYILGILKDFDEMCSRNDIEYFLFRDTLMYGITSGSLGPKPYCASVVMTGDNAARLVEAFNREKPQNRVLDYWGSNERYPDYSIRYSDTESTDFNVMDFACYNAHGAYVDISILRGEKKSNKDCKQALLLERGVLLDSQNEKTTVTIPKNKYDAKALAAYNLAKVRKGRGGIRKDLFDFFSSKCCAPRSKSKGESGYYSVVMSPRKTSEIPQNYFRKCEYCTIGGYQFPVPADARAMLSKLHPNRFTPGRNGDTVSDSFSYVENCIIDVDVPYRDMFDSGLITREELEAFRKQKFKVDMLVRSNRGNKKVTKDDLGIVAQTDYRFKMYEYYQPLKADILKMLEAEDYEGLKEVFEPYEDRLDELLRDDKSFSFDNDILDAYLKLLDHEGDLDRIDRILRFLPKSHLKDNDLVIGETK